MSNKKMTLKDIQLKLKGTNMPLRKTISKNKTLKNIKARTEVQ